MEPELSKVALDLDKFSILREEGASEAQIIGNSPPNLLRSHDTPFGKFLNICYEEDPLGTINVSPKIQISILCSKTTGDIKSFKIVRSKLTGGRWEVDSEIQLSSFSLAKLKELIELLSKIDLQAVSKGKIELIDSLGDVAELAKKLQTIASNKNGQLALQQIIESDAMEQDIVSIGFRRNQLNIFKKLLDDTEFFERYKSERSLRGGEAVWQFFFKKNLWIFGYGLKYQFLNLIHDQPNYGGTSVDGKNAQRGDYLMHTEANAKYTVLVEIKTHETEIMTNTEHRSGTYRIGKDVLWSASQVQINCEVWNLEGARSQANKSLERRSISTINPKGILVIGHTRQLDNDDKIRTFECYRQNTHNPRILTFDELYERAQFIVEHSQENIIDDVPKKSEETLQSAAEDIF